MCAVTVPAVVARDPKRYNSFMLALALTLSLVSQEPAPIPPVEVPAVPDAPVGPGKLVVLVDIEGAKVFVDGVAKGLAPVSLDNLEAGHHAVSIQPPKLPPFHVDVDVLQGRTEISAKIAQERRPADFPQKKAEYDDAMFSFGWKALGGLCGCVGGAVALAGAGVFALVPATSATIVPLATLIGGGVGCIGGTGLCGLSILDVIDSPDEPIIPRVHVVTITPPTGSEDAKVIYLEAPPVDSDGDPMDDDDDDEKKDGEDGIVEATFKY